MASSTLLLDGHLIDGAAAGPASPAASSSSSPLPPATPDRPKGLLGQIGAKGVGAMTGAVATSLLMTPFDVLKTRLQTRRPAPAPLPLLPASDPAACCQRTLNSSPASTSAARASSSRLGPAITCMSTPSFTSGSGSTLALSQPAGCSAPPSRWYALVEDLRCASRETTRGFWSEVRLIAGESGVRGFWKGVGTTMAMGIPSSAIYMVGYDHLRMALLPATPTDSQLALTPLFAGSLARTISATIISPLELFRTRLQAVSAPGERAPSVRSTLAILRTQVAAKGARTLWTGLGATLWRDVPFSGIYWAGYEVIKGRLLVGPRWEKSAASEFGAGGMGESEWARPVVAGAGSGMIAAFITTPFDVLKTRRQVFTSPRPVASGSPSTASAAVASTRTLVVLREIIRTEGTGALFAGLIPRLAKVAPACAIMVTCYEVVGGYMGGE